uniref:Uncharacterized protein n=1 Tax=Caldicellulosiruptor owensensis TaxID=55205 RepID=A0A7C5V090_9FIRM
MVNTSVIPDSIKRKLYVSRKNKIPVHVLKNVRNMLLVAGKKDLHKERVIEFVPSKVNGDVIYMDLGDRTIAYSLLYYEFFTLLEFSIFHDVVRNYGYIVKKGSSKVVGLLMPVMVPEVRNRDVQV